MPLPIRHNHWARSEMMGLFSVSSTLAGLSLTISTLFNIIDRKAAIATTADNVLTLCATMFISCTFLIFWCLRTPNDTTGRRLMLLVDTLFFLALLLMLVSSMAIVWSTK